MDAFDYVLLAAAAWCSSLAFTAVHEAGHFLPPLLRGVPALRFQVGWGVPIYSRFFGSCQLRICLLPGFGVVHTLSSASELILGGNRYASYRRVLRHHPDTHERVKQTIAESPRFESLPGWLKGVYFLGGPFTEALTAVIVLLLLSLFGGQLPLLLKGVALAALLHVAIAGAQLLPIKLGRFSSDGFYVLLYFVHGALQWFGLRPSLERVGKVLNYLLLPPWIIGLALGVIALIGDIVKTL